MYVYLLHAVNNPGIVKIGFSEDPKSRCMDIQLSAPHELTLAATIKCKSPRHARAVERQAHQLFAGRRTFGEWFRVDSIPEVVELIERTAAATAHTFRDSRIGADRAGASPLGKLLSPRELQVTSMYGQGYRCLDVASELGMSIKSVTAYAKRAAGKLGFDGPRELRRNAAILLAPLAQPQPGIRRGESAAQGAVAVAASSDVAGRTVLAPNGSQGAL
jgi:DNA-binding CsgD family transcriptional regulator